MWSTHKVNKNTCSVLVKLKSNLMPENVFDSCLCTFYTPSTAFLFFLKRTITDLLYSSPGRKHFFLQVQVFKKKTKKTSRLHYLVRNDMKQNMDFAVFFSCKNLKTGTNWVRLLLMVFFSCTNSLPDKKMAVGRVYLRTPCWRFLTSILLSCDIKLFTLIG
jgi:hypothetical protein